jgi:hypothetical protein
VLLAAREINRAFPLFTARNAVITSWIGCPLIELAKTTLNAREIKTLTCLATQTRLHTTVYPVLCEPFRPDRIKTTRVVYRQTVVTDFSLEVWRIFSPHAGRFP